MDKDFDTSFCLGLLVGNTLVRVFIFEDTILSGVIVGAIASIVYLLLKRFLSKLHGEQE